MAEASATGNLRQIEPQRWSLPMWRGWIKQKLQLGIFGILPWRRKNPKIKAFRKAERYGKINDFGNSWKIPRIPKLGNSGPSCLHWLWFFFCISVGSSTSWGSCRIRGFPEESQEVSAARRGSGNICLVSCGVEWESSTWISLPLVQYFRSPVGFRTPGAQSWHSVG